LKSATDAALAMGLRSEVRTGRRLTPFVHALTPKWNGPGMRAIEIIFF
jgi:hypothetical protein